LHVSGGNSTIRGLTISSFGNGVWLDSNGGDTVAGDNLINCDTGVNVGKFNDYNSYVLANNNTIGGTALADRNLIAAGAFGIFLTGNNNLVEGNYLGVDASGAHASSLPGRSEVLIEGSGNVIGGSAAGSGNVIGGTGPSAWGSVSVAPLGVHFTNTLIQGNLIGTDATGQFALVDPKTAYSHFDAGISLANDDGTRIIGNVISGNWNGIVGPGWPTPPTIQGNRIGTDESGTFAVPNAGDGIDLNADGSLIGGTAAGEGNIIAFNGGLGLSLDSNGFQLEGNLIHDNGLGGVSVVDDNTITSATITDNTITHNGGPGVWVRGNPLDITYAQIYIGPSGFPTGVRIQQNSITGNGGLGIDFGAIPVDANGSPTNDVNQWDHDIPDGIPQNGSPVGINNGQMFPVLLSAAVTSTSTALAGTLTGTPGATYEIEFLANTQPGHPNPANPSDPNRYGEGETSLGIRTVTIGADGIGYFFATDLPTLPAGAAFLTATATNPLTGDTSEFSAALPVPAAGGGLTVQATTQQAVDDVVAAVNAMSAPANSVTITVDLGGGNFNGIKVNPPPRVIVKFRNGTLHGHSPALLVAGGTVVVTDCTLTNATDAPTILVTGGSLALRNDVIQESTGYAQVGVLVTGGTADLGTAADPGGNTINVNGPGAPAENDTATAVASVGNVWEVNGVVVTGPAAVKATPTVQVTGGSFAYDEHAHPPTGSVTGVGGESLGTPTFTYSFTDDNGNAHTSTTPPTDPGYYTVTASYPGNDNYLPATKTATITIYYDVRTLTDLSHAFNAGRTIPIKLQLTDAAGNNVSSADIGVWAVALYRVNSDGSRTQVSLQDAGGSNPNDLFRYDSSIGGYIFNLSTKGLGAGTYVFDWMAGDDPTTHELGFKLV
jgi:hypothetical protein